MRITDSGGDEQTSYNPQPSANHIMSQIGVSSNIVVDNSGVITTDESKKVIADVQGSKLRSLLSSLKK